MRSSVLSDLAGIRGVGTMSDVQPVLFIEQIEEAIEFYRDRLGFNVNVFGVDEESGRPNIFLAKLEDAGFLVSRVPVFTGEANSTPVSGVTLYFHLDQPVDDYATRFLSAKGSTVDHEVTDQWWGDRTFAIRDPWGYRLLFSNSETEEAMRD